MSQNIKKLLNLETMIVSKRVVFKFTYTNMEITDLRMLATMELINEVLKTLYNNEVTDACFVFAVDGMKIPTNFKSLKQVASTFHTHAEIINKKLSFTIIQCNNNIFKMFFSLFKLYYEPVKPLYLCDNEDITTKCLTNTDELKKMPNIVKMIKN